MDHSYSESDVSLSPSHILERLHILRQLQLLQQGKLQKQRLEYQESPQTSSSLTEIVSQFSCSTGFSTFRSLLQSSQDITNDATPRANTSDVSPRVNPQDLIEGVSMLNLSQESGFVPISPISSNDKASKPMIDGISPLCRNNNLSLPRKKQIELDEMPILSPKKDFEALIIEKLKNEINVPRPEVVVKSNKMTVGKKPFLKRGEGMARFGLKKNDLVIQKTQALPWKKNKPSNNQVKTKPAVNNTKPAPVTSKDAMKEVKTAPLEPTSLLIPKEKLDLTKRSHSSKSTSPQQSKNNDVKQISSSIDSSSELHKEIPVPRIQLPKEKHPLLQNKGKTWAAVFTKEQDDFLRQLKQSDYYKNFTSPAKSVISDISCDENLSKLRHDREIAEQNMFELLENKVDHDSFNINNSFFNRFFKGNSLECSGESTPLIMKKCLIDNPALMKIFPDIAFGTRNEHSQSDAGTCNSECTECCNDACSSVSSCCSCNTVEESKISHNEKKVSENTKPKSKEVDKLSENEACQNDTENDMIKANMAEMNAKLIATSDLLKDRLRELEDEIETFRKENANLTKMREEIDEEKKKFFEEKSAFEQKFNEDKILSEYYLAEEKEKLTKQKQIYERYVREMRGRLNKKDKDEVVNLKQEINNLKEDIRVKDAKSTSTIARLRNQLKIMEKEKKDLQNEIEKLKKENKRITHSNEITRRLTNLKYLEEINKKLTNMHTKNTQSQVEIDNNAKYKTFEIERQSRSRRPQTVAKNIRPRAKSVPNLNVTSRYAKYFSQRDVVSPIERNQTINIEGIERSPSEDGDRYQYDNESQHSDEIESIHDNENSLEKIYMERFSQGSQSDIQGIKTNSAHHSFDSANENTDRFFVQRSNSASSSARDLEFSRSPHFVHQSSSNINRPKSPISILSNRSGRKSPSSSQEKIEYTSNYSSRISNSRSKSPISVVSHTYSSQRATVVNRDYDNRMVVSPEPTSKTSLTKTDLKPMEIRKPDGTRELRFPNGNVKYISPDGKYSKFVYYNGDVKENFYNEGRIKYYYAETKTFHTTHPDGLEVLEFSDGQVEKRYKDGSTEIRLPNGSVRYYDPKNEHVREEWRFPDGATLTVSAAGERRVVFPNGQVEVHTKEHKRREFPDGTVKLVYNDGTSETRYCSGRVRIKDRHGNLIMDSVPG